MHQATYGFGSQEKVMLAIRD